MAWTPGATTRFLGAAVNRQNRSMFNCRLLLNLTKLSLSLMFHLWTDGDDAVAGASSESASASGALVDNEAMSAPRSKMPF